MLTTMGSPGSPVNIFIHMYGVVWTTMRELHLFVILNATIAEVKAFLKEYHLSTTVKYRTQLLKRVANFFEDLTSTQLKQRYL